MMHFEAAIARTVEAVPLGERFQEACADTPMLDRRVGVVEDPDGRTGADLGHIGTGVLRPVVDLDVGARVCRGRHGSGLYFNFMTTLPGSGTNFWPIQWRSLRFSFRIG